MAEFVQWFNALPWVKVSDSWIQASGMSNASIGYLLALVVLGALGVFRSRE